MPLRSTTTALDFDVVRPREVPAGDLERDGLRSRCALACAGDSPACGSARSSAAQTPMGGDWLECCCGSAWAREPAVRCCRCCCCGDDRCCCCCCGDVRCCCCCCCCGDVRCSPPCGPTARDAAPRSDLRKPAPEDGGLLRLAGLPARSPIGLPPPPLRLPSGCVGGDRSLYGTAGGSIQSTPSTSASTRSRQSMAALEWYFCCSRFGSLVPATPRMMSSGTPRCRRNWLNAALPPPILILVTCFSAFQVSKVTDCTKEICTPSDRCMPEHARQMNVPCLRSSKTARRR